MTILDKNDSPPSFQAAPVKYTISEDLGPGQQVAVLKAIDPDTIGRLDYTLVSGDDGHFSLDSRTGVLQLKESLDRETKDTYRLLVRASDGLQHTDTVITVQVRVWEFRTGFSVFSSAVMIISLVKTNHACGRDLTYCGCNYRRKRLVAVSRRGRPFMTVSSRCPTWNNHKLCPVGSIMQ